MWIRHPDKVWEGAEVIQDYKGAAIRVKTEDGTVSSMGTVALLRLSGKVFDLTEYLCVRKLWGIIRFGCERGLFYWLQFSLPIGCSEADTSWLWSFDGRKYKELGIFSFMDFVFC